MFSWSAKCGFIDFNESQPLMTLRFVFGNWSGIHLRAVDDNDGWGKNGRSLAGERQCNVWEWREAMLPQSQACPLLLCPPIASNHYLPRCWKWMLSSQRRENIFDLLHKFARSDVNLISRFVRNEENKAADSALQNFWKSFKNICLRIA